MFSEMKLFAICICAVSIGRQSPSEDVTLQIRQFAEGHYIPLVSVWLIVPLSLSSALHPFICIQSKMMPSVFTLANNNNLEFYCDICFNFEVGKRKKRLLSLCKNCCRCSFIYTIKMALKERIPPPGPNCPLLKPHLNPLDFNLDLHRIAHIHKY